MVRKRLIIPLCTVALAASSISYPAFSKPAAAQGAPCTLASDEDISRALGTSVQSAGWEDPNAAAGTVYRTCSVSAEDDDGTSYYMTYQSPVFDNPNVRATPYDLVAPFAQQSAHAVIDQINAASSAGVVLTIQDSTGKTYEVTPISGRGDAAIAYRATDGSRSLDLEFAQGPALMNVNAHPDRPVETLVALARVMLANVPRN